MFGNSQNNRLSTPRLSQPASYGNGSSEQPSLLQGFGDDVDLGYITGEHNLDAELKFGSGDVEFDVVDWVAKIERDSDIAAEVGINSSASSANFYEVGMNTQLIESASRNATVAHRVVLRSNLTDINQGLNLDASARHRRDLFDANSLFPPQTANLRFHAPRQDKHKPSSNRVSGEMHNTLAAWEGRDSASRLGDIDFLDDFRRDAPVAPDTTNSQHPAPRAEAFNVAPASEHKLSQIRSSLEDAQNLLYSWLAVEEEAGALRQSAGSAAALASAAVAAPSASSNIGSTQTQGLSGSGASRVGMRINSVPAPFVPASSSIAARERAKAAVDRASREAERQRTFGIATGFEIDPTPAVRSTLDEHISANEDRAAGVCVTGRVDASAAGAAVGSNGAFAGASLSLRRGPVHANTLVQMKARADEVVSKRAASLTTAASRKANEQAQTVARMRGAARAPAHPMQSRLHGAGHWPTDCGSADADVTSLQTGSHPSVPAPFGASARVKSSAAAATPCRTQTASLSEDLSVEGGEAVKSAINTSDVSITEAATIATLRQLVTSALLSPYPALRD